MSTTFGRYQLEQRIGIGGMGEVFAGKSTGAEGFERPCAIKVILPEFCDDAEFREMFVDEAKISMFLQHANIVQVLDLGEIGGRYYLAMEYVEGPSLSRVLKLLQKRGQLLPIPLAVYILVELLKGLDYAHKARDRSGKPLAIVHRDVTPQNVLVSMAGEVKLSDFGIARASTRNQRTQTGVVRGKLYYISPEQLESSSAVGPWSDVYAAGTLLLTLLLGKNPLDGKSESEVMDRLRALDPVAIADPRIPGGLYPVLQRALEPNYRRRYQTAQAFQEGLDEFILANKIKTGARLVAEFLHGIAVLEANERGLPAPPSPSEMPAEVHTTQTPSFAARDHTSSLALVLGSVGDPLASLAQPLHPAATPNPLTPAPLAALANDLLSGGPPKVTVVADESRLLDSRGKLAGAPAAAFAALAIIGVLGALGFGAGRVVRDRAPVALPPVASHAGALDAASANGWVFFDPYPWAEVTIDGSKVGGSPLVAHPLPPGKHVLEYQSIDGATGRLEFEVRPGRPVVLSP